ncbi:MAG: hypothetical protein JXP37_05535 [Coriobacteriia bacterium]|nr:hypothetical protein [Coriobacteriia bacterium]
MSRLVPPLDILCAEGRALRLETIAWTAVVFAGLLLVFTRGSDGTEGSLIFLECVGPLVLAFMFPAVYAEDRRRGVHELIVPCPASWMVQARKLLLTSALVAALATTSGWLLADTSGLDTASAIIGSVLPTLALGALAYCLTVMIGAESVALATTSALWAVEQMPAVTRAFVDAHLEWLYLFPLSKGIGGPHTVNRIALSCIALLLFVVGVRASRQVQES